MRIAILIFAGATAFAQTPKFEVASIKPSPPDAIHMTKTGGPSTNDPGLFRCTNYDLLSLITVSFHIPELARFPAAF